MKKLFSTILVAIVATVASYAQTIAVVSSNGVTTMHQTLADAIDKAASGSVIYLPGGGFQLSDDTKITKKLTIMGVSHRADTDNAEGATTIAGNVWFNNGSNGSAIMGCHVSGDINIGADAPVDNILVKYCNVNSVKIKKKDCSGTMINQCYMRSSLGGGSSSLEVSNCVLNSIGDVDGGVIDHNIIVRSGAYTSYGYYALAHIYNSVISNNIVISASAYRFGDENQFLRNMVISSSWDKSSGKEIIVSDWNDVFENPDDIKDVNIMATYKFKETYSQYSDIGIYGGSGFDPHALAPIPRIISKEIPEQTDASGKLNIKITVKAK